LGLCFHTRGKRGRRPRLQSKVLGNSGAFANELILKGSRNVRPTMFAELRKVGGPAARSSDFASPAAKRWYRDPFDAVLSEGSIPHRSVAYGGVTAGRVWLLFHRRLVRLRRLLHGADHVDHGWIW